MFSLVFSILLAMPFSSAFAGLSNSPPVLGELTDKTEEEDDSITISFSATDPDDSDILSFTASGLPTFGQLVDYGDKTADLIFETENDSSGTYTITVTVTDNGSPQLSDSDTFTLTVTNDIEGELALIDETVDDVAELAEDGTLTNGQATSLVKILENSVKKLESDQIATAINMLETFIKKINALINSGQLDSAIGQPLIDDIQEIIDTLAWDFLFNLYQ